MCTTPFPFGNWDLFFVTEHFRYFHYLSNCQPTNNVVVQQANIVQRHFIMNVQT